MFFKNMFWGFTGCFKDFVGGLLDFMLEETVQTSPQVI